MFYNVAGVLSSLMFVLCLSGLLDQIIKIVSKLRLKEQNVTKVFSLNQFASSYLSFYGFFIYSFLIGDINLYLFCTRLLACLLTLGIIVLLAIDRKTFTTMIAVCVGILSLIVAALLLFSGQKVSLYAKNISIVMILVATILLAQGGLHQILKIRKDRSVGLLSFRMNLFFMLKDVSNVVFAFAMGMAEGWPLIIMGTVSGTMKIGVLYHFIWTKKINKLTGNVNDYQTSNL